jgi:hypothetical protein
VGQSHSGLPETRKWRYRRTISDAVHTIPFRFPVNCPSFQRLCTVTIIFDVRGKREVPSIRNPTG